MPSIRETLARLMPRRVRDVALAQLAAPYDSKASRTGALIAFETLGRPVWAPRDYAAFAREGFMQNAVVYRSVRMIAEAAASVPLVLYDGVNDLDTHPLLDLLAEPSPGQTQAGFLESWYGYLLVSGNAYAEATSIDGQVRELYALRPDRMKVVPGSNGWPEAYEYTVNAETIRFDTEPVSGVRPILHMRMFHPANDHYGLSPIEAAATAIDIHNAASEWNKALLDNSARPSGALVYGANDGRMSAEQFDRLKAEMEAGFTGPKQAGRPLLLEGGLDWKPLSLSPKDMDFIEAKNAAAREIALALGVPPMLLGIPGDNTYSNFQEATRSFWRQTVLPLAERTGRALASWLAPTFGGQITMRPDLDQIEALSGEREALWARIERASFLTADEKRAAVGYGPLPGGHDLNTGTQVTQIKSSDAFGIVSPETHLLGASDSPAGSRPEAQRPFDGAASRGFPRAASLKYSPDQPRVSAGNSDGGQWTDGGGGGGTSGGGSSSGQTDSRVLSDANPDTFTEPGTQTAQTRRPSTRGSNRAQATSETAEYYRNLAADNLQQALSRVRQSDPEWKPTPRLYDRNSIESETITYRSMAEEANARAAFLERGGVPFGFAGREDFEQFGRDTRAMLDEAGHRDAEVYLRGSSVTGVKYTTGRPYDGGTSLSDLDLAIVSPRLFEAAQNARVRTLGNNSRTEPLNQAGLRELGLESTVMEIRINRGRDASFVIFRSREALEARGASRPITTIRSAK